MSQLQREMLRVCADVELAVAELYDPENTAHQSVVAREHLDEFREVFLDKLIEDRICRYLLWKEVYDDATL